MKYHVKVITPCGHLAVYHKELLQAIEDLRASGEVRCPEATWDFAMKEGTETPKVVEILDPSGPSANPQAAGEALGGPFQRALNAAWKHVLKQD